jgi:hypothetical protein
MGASGRHLKPVGGLDRQQGLGQDQCSSRLRMQISWQEHPPPHIYQNCGRDSVLPEDIEVLFGQGCGTEDLAK